MSQEFLFVLWAGGGNVPPQLALARRLVDRGHRVRMLAPAVLRESIEAAGIEFERYREIPEHDESVPERAPNALEAVAGHGGSPTATTPRRALASEVVSTG